MQFKRRTSENRFYQTLFLCYGAHNNVSVETDRTTEGQTDRRQHDKITAHVAASTTAGRGTSEKMNNIQPETDRKRAFGSV